MEDREQAPSLAEQAYLLMRRDILVCALAPGQVVTERELGERYKTGKTPTREALSQICHDGLVKRLPGRGYMVTPVTVKDLRDLFGMRLILELAAAEQTARLSSPALVVELRRLATISYEVEEQESRIQYLKGNRIFHLTLAYAAGNNRLTITLEEILVELDRYFHLGLRLRDSSGEIKTEHEHEDVVAALEAGDIELLTSGLEEHILASRNRILEAIMQGDMPTVQFGG